MDTVLEYKCPCCGGAINFDTASQKMKCPYCDSEFDVETVKDYNKQAESEQGENYNWDDYGEDSGSGDWREGEQDGMRYYTCNSCGGEIIADDTTSATSCPYCGNPVVMSGQVSGMLRPDLVIPFKLDKNAAKAALQNHYKGKLLLPKLFKSQNHIDEIKGVYVPFWLYDCDVDASMTFHGKRVRSWSDSKYRYTETTTYLATRQGEVGFDKVPVDGSSKMPDDMMESVEPFKWDDAVDFETAYLAGYLADKYDVDAKASIPRANERITQSTEDKFRETVIGYDSVTTRSKLINLKQGNVRYALLPIWMLSSSWNGKKYMFAMNGQTGKLIGDLPVDKGLFAKYFSIFAAGIAALTFGGLYLYWLL